jgi:hypothetical protein
MMIIDMIDPIDSIGASLWPYGMGWSGTPAIRSIRSLTVPGSPPPPVTSPAPHKAVGRQLRMELV